MKVNTSKSKVVVSASAGKSTQRTTDRDFQVVHVEQGQALPHVVEYTAKLSVADATVDDANIVAKSRIEYVANFRNGAEKTARSTLDMCRTVYEANRTLNSGEFHYFCKEIGYNDYSSTIRKFITIGKVYPRLIQYAEQLPSAWTSIYQITQIPAEAFDTCISKGRLLNRLKGKELKLLVNATKDMNDLGEPLFYNKKLAMFAFGKLYFTKRPDDIDWRAMEKALAEMEARLPIRFIVSSGAKELIQKRRDQRYERTKEHVEHIEWKPEHWDLGREANAALSISAPLDAVNEATKWEAVADSA